MEHAAVLVWSGDRWGDRGPARSLSRRAGDVPLRVIDFDELGPTRATCSIAADARHHSRGD
jgi:hypothetical protein